jgi:carbon storage regulator CsrA
MLILGRTAKQGFIIGGDCEVKVLKVKGKKVTLGVNVDKQVSVVRTELIDNWDKPERLDDEHANR